MLFASCLLSLPGVGFGQAPNLGTAASFALFTANGAVSNTGASVVTGDVGTNVGAFNAFPPGTVVGQIRLPSSTEASVAATNVALAYTALNSVGCGTLIGPTLGNGQVLTAGVYCQTTAAASSLTGTLVLDGPGIYIIKLNSALTTASGSTISLINGACATDVYFQVNGATDLGTGSVFKGTILANGAISLGSGASLEGRGLSIGGTISLNTNSVALPPVLAISSVVSSTCNPANNQYALTGTLALTAAVPGTLTITDGSSTTTVTITVGQTSASFSLSALLSGTGTHSVMVSGGGYCSPNAFTYAAPASCTVAVSSAVSLTGVVYADNNTSGSYDGGDTPIAGAVVTLLNGTSTPIATTTTSPTGTYSFSGLTAGLPYSVSVATPVGYSAVVAGGVTGPVTLTTGTTNPSLNVGYTKVTPLTLSLLVSKSIAAVGDVLTYTVVLTNPGTTPASNVVVRDSTTTGLTYLANSATVPLGTTFTPGSPISSWLVASLGAGQSLALTFQATVGSAGILYNTVSIASEVQVVCTSIPVKLCPGDEYVISVPAGSPSYSWYKDGVLITGQTSNSLTINAPGSYSLGINTVGGLCPNFSCCPFIVEADLLPVYSAAAISSTCLGGVAQDNGYLLLSGFNATHTYQYSLGATFDPASSLSGAPQAIPTNGLIASNLANPLTVQQYTIRVTNSNGCYTDVTVSLQPTTCVCPANVCVPFTLRRTKGVAVR